MRKITYKGVVAAPAEKQMELDLRILKEGPSNPTLRIGIWEPPAVSLGRRQSPTGKFDPERLASRGLDVVVRPTGGLFILHHPGTITIHITIPLGSPLYGEEIPLVGLEIAMMISNALNKLGFDTYTWERVPQRDRVTRYETDICLAYKGASDILYNGLKIGAGALRKTSKGILYQGYLVLDRPLYDLWAWIDQYPDHEELAEVFGGLGSSINLGRFSLELALQLSKRL